AGAVLWGLGRTMSAEHPDRWRGLVDLDAADDDADDDAGGDGDRSAIAERLASALLDAPGEDQLALRGAQLLAARLEPYAAPAAAALDVRVDATYLVTGGLGELGLATARWLVASGARRIVLLGRSGLPSRAQWRRLD